MDRQSITGVIKELIAETTGEPCEHIADDQDLRNGLGLDSVDLFSLVVETQSRFGIKIASEELMSITKVGDYLDMVQAKLADPPSTAHAA